MPSAVQLERLPEVGVPSTGVTSVGEVANTSEPLPVSSVTAAARFALDGVPKNVKMPVPVVVVLGATPAPPPMTSYSLVTTDVGKFVGVGTSGSITVPNSTFAAGDVVSIFNNTTGNVTLTMSITTAYIAGTNADKDTMTLATRGVATILFISGTVCVVSGNVT